ncbi:type II toxin-antitoxin system death-on-curing family toxin [Compostimonas suwonensis]|uniref:Death-on-curing protein n=1 Tax=Compostimonas suwonensis TaxID=1048394 RepID=A0A2M9BBB2_9MICO|nr:Fic family protein [Compostimonas suwonensis]PJJ55230.1 death-on-curing protein [Compostimonas suwonensis]
MPILPTPVVRDIGLIESALQRGNLTIFGNEVYIGIHAKVAAVVDSLSRNHPLPDGNKRLAALASIMIYEGNGYRYVGADSDDDLFVDIARHDMGFRQIAVRFAALWEPRSEAPGGRAAT